MLKRCRDNQKLAEIRQNCFELRWLLSRWVRLSILIAILARFLNTLAFQEWLRSVAAQEKALCYFNVWIWWFNGRVSLNTLREEFNFSLVTGKCICFQRSSSARMKWLTLIHDEAVQYIHYSYKHYEVLCLPLKCISNNKYLFYWEEMNLTFFN